MSWPELVSTAIDDPGLVLVALFDALHEDTDWFESAGRECWRNAVAHQRVVQRMLDGLRRGTELEVEPDRALALLEALDGYLDEMDPNPSAERPPRRVTVDDRSYWLFRRGLCWSRPAERNSLKWQRWLRRHWVVPTRVHRKEVRIQAVDGSTRRELERVADGSIRVAFGSFSDRIEPRWTTTPGASEGQVSEELLDAEGRWTSLSSHLERAQRDGADWLILPELTVPPELRMRIADWLHDHRDGSLWMVVAGSYHEPRSAGGWINRAVILGGDGSELLRHAKLAPFDSAALKFSEDIQAGREIEVLSGPLGSMALGICRDCCEEAPFPREVWTTLGPAVLFVPSMDASEGLRAYGRRAEELARAHATISLQANQPPDARPDRPAQGEERNTPPRVLLCSLNSGDRACVETAHGDYRLWEYDLRRREGELS